MAGQGGNGQHRLIYWLLGLLQAVFLAGAVWLASLLGSQGDAIRHLEVSIATRGEQVNNLLPLLYSTRQEQMDRTKLFGELRERLSLMEQRLLTFEERLNTQSQRILSINQRLDTVAPASPRAPR